MTTPQQTPSIDLKSTPECEATWIPEEEEEYEEEPDFEAAVDRLEYEDFLRDYSGYDSEEDKERDPTYWHKGFGREDKY